MRPATGQNFGRSEVSVRVYIRSELVYRGKRELTDPNQLWEVGQIVWTDEEQTFEETNVVLEDVEPF